MSFGNRVGNTAAVLPRTAGTGVLGGLDVVKTGATAVSQFGEVIADTGSKIRDVFKNSRTKGKFLQKVFNIAASPFVAAGTAVEGVVRSVVEPVGNALMHTRDVLGNVLTNGGRTVHGLASKDPINAFKYDSLKTKPVSKKNWISRWQWLK